MTKSHQDPSVTEDIDIQSLGRALWRAKGWILGPRRATPATEPRLQERRAPANPAIAPAAATATRSTPITPPMPEVETHAMTSAPEIWKPSSTDQVERSPGRSSRIFSPASVEGDSEPQRPSFLQSRRRSDAPPFLATAQADASPTAPPVPTHASDTAPSEQSAAGLINRLRRSLSPSQGAPEALPPAPKSAWLERLRASKPTPEAIKADKFDTAVMSTPGDIMPTLSTNDLRAYLNQRLASRGTEAANDPIRKSDAIPSKVGDKAQPLLKSLGAVINHILGSGNGGAPRALLVVGASPKVDATSEAIRIARALVAKGEQIVLVDLTRGPAAISGPLGIPRSPGLSDLAAGRAGFEDIVRVDVETPLQVIAAGNPKLAASGDENGHFSRVFDALTQAYDCVVLHADREAVRALTPALKFELPLVIAVLPAGAGASNDEAGLADFAALGCPVMVYEQTAKQPRSRLFGRVAVG